jgi:hypothetical protein
MWPNGRTLGFGERRRVEKVEEQPREIARSKRARRQPGE